MTSVSPKAIVGFLVYILGMAAIWQVSTFTQLQEAGAVARRLTDGQTQQQPSPLQGLGGLVWQAIWGFIFFSTILPKYPALGTLAPNEAAIRIQGQNAISGCMAARPMVMVHSCCCIGPRHALTMHATGVMEYWPSCVLMSCFPCFFMIYSQAITDLNVKLGGQKENIVSACICSCCCSCCLTAQDAQSLEEITRVRTSLCGVEGA